MWQERNSKVKKKKRKIRFSFLSCLSRALRGSLIFFGCCCQMLLISFVEQMLKTYRTRNLVLRRDTRQPFRQQGMLLSCNVFKYIYFVYLNSFFSLIIIPRLFLVRLPHSERCPEGLFPPQKLQSLLRYLLFNTYDKLVGKKKGMVGQV